MDIICLAIIGKTPVKYGTGQNNLWFDQNMFIAIITENGINIPILQDLEIRLKL